jgi:hypothetical protein
MNRRGRSLVWRIPIRLARVVPVVFAAGLLMLASAASGQPAPGKKIDYRILYAGHPGSDREKEFVEFLGKQFQEVKTTDLAKFSEARAQGFDVVVLDYDGDGFKAPRPNLTSSYRQATVTIGVAGGMFSASRGLKTGYM